MHNIYILKGCFNFLDKRRTDVLIEEQKELFFQNMNHDKWRWFKEAMKIEESIHLDTTYQMVFQNQIMKIWCGENNGFLHKGVGRLIKPNYGKDTLIRKEYQQMLDWYEILQLDS